MSSIHAIIYLRDCIFDPSCNCDDNIKIDEDNNKLWFIKDGNESVKFDLDLSTPLISHRNASYTLHQLFVFTNHYICAEQSWADYVLEATFINQDIKIENDEQYQLNDYLTGKINIFNQNINTKVPSPKLLLNNNNTNNYNKKRKSNENYDNNQQPPHKRQKLKINKTSSSEPRKSSQQNQTSTTIHYLSKIIIITIIKTAITMKIMLLSTISHQCHSGIH